MKPAMSVPDAKGNENAGSIRPLKANCNAFIDAAKTDYRSIII